MNKAPIYTINRDGTVFSVTSETFEFVRERHVKGENVNSGHGLATKDHTIEIEETKDGFVAILTPVKKEEAADASEA